jgi:hypothetical protein
VSIFPVAPHRVWGKLLTRLTLHRVHGNHGSIVRDHAGELAAAMSRVIDRAAATL